MVLLIGGIAVLGGGDDSGDSDEALVSDESAQGVDGQVENTTTAEDDVLPVTTGASDDDAVETEAPDTAEDDDAEDGAADDGAG